MGLNEGINGDYGITRFTVTDAPRAANHQNGPQDGVDGR